MAIVFKPEIAFFMYLVALILSLLPKRLFSNFLLSIFDLVALGSGEIARKRYFDGIMIFLGSGIIYFLIYVIRDYYIQTSPVFAKSQISFMANFVVIIGTIFFVLYYSANRGMEIFKETLDREHEEYINMMNKHLEEFSKKTGQPFTPISRIHLPRHDRLYTNAIGETEEERARKDMDWLDEVMRIHDEHVQLHLQDEMNREQNDPF